MSKATLEDEHVDGNRRQDKADTKEQCLDYDGREFYWDKSGSSHIRWVDEELSQERIVKAANKYELSSQSG